jgi:hypothetical protein
MALSGVYALTSDFDDIAQEVMEILQVVGDGETITTAMKDKIKPTLNLMLKAWEGQGIHLWTYTEGTLFLQVGQAEYDLRNASTKITNTWHETTLAQDEVLGAGTITVLDASDITNGDDIGIIDDTNNLFWTTVNGAPVGDVVTLTAVLPTAVTSGSIVYNYTDTIIPVRRVLNVRRRESTDYEIPINFESRGDYFDLPNKNQRGLPIQAYYSRQETQGIFYLWTTPSSATSVINFTYERETQIISADSDNFDIPSYWLEAVAYNLADRLTYKFSCTPERKQMIKMDATQYLNSALSFDDAVYPIELEIQQYG